MSSQHKSAEYGRVVEMRINRNSGPKLPFFGFIVFDEAEPVQTILTLKKSKVSILIPFARCELNPVNVRLFFEDT